MRISESPRPDEPHEPYRRCGDALAQAILSGGWDTERDLVVLVGSDPAPEAVALRRLGQQRILWFRTCDEAEIEPLAGVIRVDHLDEVAPAVHALGMPGPDLVTGRALDPAHAPLYDQIIARVERARIERFLSSELDAGAAATRARIEQGLANLPAFCRWPSVAAVGGALAGVPMLIVAPGPSLARNIEQISALRGRAVLLALSHSLAPLLRAGVTPDFVLAADAHDVSYHLAGEDLSAIGAVIATVTAHPSLFRTPAPRHLTLAEPSRVDSWLCDLVAGARDPDSSASPLSIIPSGGSVAHTALALALAWGCNPIGFVGLDLSFPLGECYAENCPDHAVRPVISPDGRTLSLEGWREASQRGRATGSERLVELPGWDGHPLPSTFHFSMCQRWFEETARRVAGTVRLYNCSEGGAYIGGMRHIRLAGLASHLPPAAALDPTDIAERAIGRLDAPARRRAVRERLVQLAVDLRSCHALERRDLAAVLESLPLVSALVHAEMGALSSAAAGQTDGERRFAALVRWGTWLEPRLIEAERALAREDRGGDTRHLRPAAASAKLG